MATESYPEVIEGCLGNEAITVDMIADEAITLWSPVILVTAGSGEDMPRVEPTNTAENGLVFGVAVDRVCLNTYGRLPVSRFN